MQEDRVNSDSRSVARSRARRRFSFSLRWLLLIVTLLAIPLTWVAWIVRDGRRQERAVEIVSSRAQYLTYHHEPPYNNIYQRPDNDDTPVPGPAWLRRILGEHCFLEVRSVDGALDERSMAALAEFDTLRGLTLRGEGANDHALRHMTSLHSLKSITISNCPVTDRGLRHIASLHSLKWLDISNCPVTGRGLRHIASLHSLKSLDISGCPVTDCGLCHIASLHSVEKLQISHCPVTDDGLHHLGSLTQLRSLRLSLENVTDDGLQHLAPLRHLRSLWLWYWDTHPEHHVNIRGLGFRDCPDFPELEDLKLHCLPIEDEALQYIARYKRLKELHLSHTKIRGPGLPYLADLPDLRSVMLVGCPISDEAVVHLKRLKQVGFLGLSETGLSQQALDELREALPDCNVSGDRPEEAKVRRSHCITAKCLDENGNDSKETDLYVSAEDDLKTAIMALDQPGMPAAILGDAERLQLVEALKKSQEWAKTARENGIQSQVQDLLDLRREDTTGTGKRGLALRLVYSATGPQEERCRVFLDICSVVDGATATVICEPEHVKELMSALDEISEALDALREGKPVSY